MKDGGGGSKEFPCNYLSQQNSMDECFQNVVLAGDFALDSPEVSCSPLKTDLCGFSGHKKDIFAYTSSSLVFFQNPHLLPGRTSYVEYFDSKFTLFISSSIYCK